MCVRGHMQFKPLLFKSIIFYSRFFRGNIMSKLPSDKKQKEEDDLGTRRSPFLQSPKFFCIGG